MDNENIISALELFNEKATKLSGSNFLKKAASGQSIRFKGGLGWPIEVVGDGPDQENDWCLCSDFSASLSRTTKHPHSPTFRRFTNLQAYWIITEPHFRRFEEIWTTILTAHALWLKRTGLIRRGRSWEYLYLAASHTHIKSGSACMTNGSTMIVFVHSFCLNSFWFFGLSEAMIDFVAGLNNEVIKLFQEAWPYLLERLIQYWSSDKDVDRTCRSSRQPGRGGIN